MAAYKIDGVALTGDELSMFPYFAGQALGAQVASRELTVRSDFCTDADNFADCAWAYADAMILAYRSRLAEQARDEAEAEALKAPPAGPTGHYWLGRTEEIDQWIRTRRSVRPRVVSLVESVRRKIAETRRPVSLVQIVNGWGGSSMVDVKALIGARILVEAPEGECADLNAFEPGARQEALAMRVLVMAAEGLPSDLEAQEVGGGK